MLSKHGAATVAPAAFDKLGRRKNRVVMDSRKINKLAPIGKIRAHQFAEISAHRCSERKNLCTPDIAGGGGLHIGPNGDGSGAAQVLTLKAAQSDLVLVDAVGVRYREVPPLDQAIVRS